MVAGGTEGEEGSITDDEEAIEGTNVDVKISKLDNVSTLVDIQSESSIETSMASFSGRCMGDGVIGGSMLVS